MRDSRESSRIKVIPDAIVIAGTLSKNEGSLRWTTHAACAEEYGSVSREITKVRGGGKFRRRGEIAKLRRN